MPNLPRVMLRAPLRVVAWMLLLLVGLAASDGKSKNPAAPAVKREAEEDWGKERWR